MGQATWSEVVNGVEVQITAVESETTTCFKWSIDYKGIVVLGRSHANLASAVREAGLWSKILLETEWTK